MFIFFDKNTDDVLFCYGNKPKQIFSIAENPNGYWDAPYRYHHRNGYFIDKGDDTWQEYQNDEPDASFVRVYD